MPRITNMPLSLIVALFCGVSIYLFYRHGVKIVNDSSRYLEYAGNLENGFYFDQHNFWYIGYVLFVFVINLFFDGPLSIVIAQYILSLIAVVLVYKTSLLLFINTKAAIISSVSYILFIEILSWNSYILCESLYCSLTCISLYLIACTYKRTDPPPYLYILTAVAVGITTLTKPTGIALLGAILTIAFIRLWHNKKNISFRIAAALVVGTTFILVINKMLSTYLVIENYQLGEVIYAITTLPHNALYDTLIIDPPDNIYIPSQQYPPLLRIVMFILNNPFYFFWLFSSKVFYFIFHIRPYWSLTHNLFTLLFLIPFYFYCIRAFVAQNIQKEIKIFSAIYLLIHCISIGLTSEDWDGRFLMPLLPLIFLLGASEISTGHKRFLVCQVCLSKHHCKSHQQEVASLIVPSL